MIDISHWSYNKGEAPESDVNKFCKRNLHALNMCGWSFKYTNNTGKIVEVRKCYKINNEYYQLELSYPENSFIRRLSDGFLVEYEYLKTYSNMGSWDEVNGWNIQDELIHTDFKRLLKSKDLNELFEKEGSI